MKLSPFAAFGLFFLAVATPAFATTYTVDRSDDSATATACTTAANDCSLRGAITAANLSTATPHTIEFSIPTTDSGYLAGIWTISPTSQLPKLTRGQTTIDGTTQSGTSANTASYPDALNGTFTLVISGTSAGASSYGLVVNNSASNVIKGLVINNFRGSGVLVSGASATGNKIQGCLIGTDATGESAAPNSSGVYIASSNNTVGTDGDGTNDAAERNLISGNTSHGVVIGGNSNRISGNFIGTDKDGDTDLGNGSYGAFVGTDSNIFGTNSDGTADSIEGNLISGNNSSGFYFGTAADNNIVAANRIGTTRTGLAALGNTQYGLYIAGNGTMVGTHTNGTSGTSEGNLISGNGSSGIHVNNGSGTIIAGNFIGTDATGAAALRNTSSGVSIVRPSARVGTDADGVNDAAERNVISGNGYMGIYVYGANATGITIAGNYIGVAADGVSDLGNGSHGVGIYNSASSNLVGGTASGSGNVIAYNGDSGSEYGLVVYASTTLYNRVLGNSFLQNQSDGIRLWSSGNGSKAAPVISGQSAGSGSTVGFSGTADATSDTVQLFKASSDSEGQTYLGQATADASKSWIVSVDRTLLTTGDVIIATGTSTTNNTSAFSATYTVTALNSTPAATAGTASTDEDTDVTITLSATDADGDALTYAIASSPTKGSLSAIVGDTVTYTPNPNENGSDSFSFTAGDASSTSSPATVSLSITAVNDAPTIATAPTATLDEDTATTITLTGTDVDGDTLTYSVTSGPTNGSATAPGSGNTTLYTPTPNYYGPDSLSYQVSDGTLAASATVLISVNDVAETNTPPIAGDMTVYAGTGMTASFTLDGSDADATDVLTYSHTTPSSGSLSGTAPALSYEPIGVFTSSITFEYTVTDLSGDSDTGTVTIMPAGTPIHIGAGGFITRLYQDPTDPDSCWATSDIGGLFLSEDGCQTFTPKNNSFERADHFYVDDVSVDPADSTGNTVYAFSGTYAKGTGSSANYPVSYGCCLWKSTDRGENFSPVFRQSSGGACNYSTTYGYNSCSSRGTRGTAYLRQDGRKEERIYHTNSTSSDMLSKRRMADGKRIAFDPSTCTGTACTTVYVADFDKGVYKSEDSGSSFAQLPLPPIVSGTTLRVSSINLVPYTVSGSTQYLILVGARKAHRGSASIVTNAYGDGALYLGFNGGESPSDWATIALPSSSVSDITDIAVSATLDLGTIDATDTIHYAAGKAGIVKGEFTALNATTPSATMSFSYASNYCGSGTVASGTGTVVAASGSYGAGLDFESRCDYADGVSTYVAVEVDPDNDNNLYAATAEQDDPQIYHSTDGGVNWSALVDYSSYSNFDFNNIWFDGQRWKIASFAGTITFVNRDQDGVTSAGGSAVAFADFWSTWKSPNDGSDDFTAYYQGIENVVLGEIAADPFDSDRLYLGVSDHAFFLSEDGGDTTALFSSGIADGQGIGQSISYSNTESVNGYADSMFLAANNNTTQGGAVYESTDGGATYTDIGTPAGLPVGNVKAVTFDSDNNRLYVALNSSPSLSNSYGTGDGSYSGLYCMEKSGSTWSSATQITAFNTALGIATTDTTYSPYIFNNEASLDYHSTSGNLFVLHNANSTAITLTNYRRLFSYTPGTTCSNGTFTAIETCPISTTNTADTTVSSTCSASASVSRTQLLSLAVDPSDANKIYLGSYLYGIWYTSDSGANWTRYYFDPDSATATTRSSSYFNRSANDILIHPSDPNIVILGGRTNYYDDSSASYYGVESDVIAAGKKYYAPGIVVYNATTGVYTDISSVVAPFGRSVMTLHTDTNLPYRLLVGMSGQGGAILNLQDIIDWSGTALEH